MMTLDVQPCHGVPVLDLIRSVPTSSKALLQLASQRSSEHRILPMKQWHCCGTTRKLHMDSKRLQA